MKKISVIFLSLFSAYAVAMDEQEVASRSYVPEVPAASEAAPSKLQAFLERFTTKVSAKETTPVVVAPEVSAPV